MQSAFSAVLQREWRYLKSHPWDLSFLTLVPGLALLLCFWLFSAGRASDLPVAVFDQDHSALSRTLVRFLDAAPALKVHIEVGSDAEAVSLLRQGHVYALIRLPRGMQHDVYRGLPVGIEVMYNAQLATIAGMVKADIQKALLLAAAGAEMRQRVSAGENAHLARISVEPLRTQLRVLFNPDLDFALFLLPALLPALLHILAMTVAVVALGRELKAGSGSDWLQRAQGCWLPALFGKLLPAFIAYLLWGVLVLAWVARAGDSGFDSGWWLTVLAYGLLVLACFSLAIPVLAFAGSLRMALSVTGFYTAPAFSYSGLIFPLYVMPLGAQVWASLLPFTHYLKVQQEQLLMDAPLRVSLPDFLVQTLMVLLPLLALPRLGRLLREGEDRG
ncbi:MAG: ABC transporter permease [Pedobacter sp.]|nr:ABC transporter permease [Pedobacter sp.]